jgi:hypothetical protein
MLLTRVSSSFVEAVKLAKMPRYRLARAAGDFDPSLISKWLNGAARVRRGDLRVVRVGELVGVPADACFEPEVEAHVTAQASKCESHR